MYTQYFSFCFFDLKKLHPECSFVYSCLWGIDFSHCYKTCIILSTAMGHREFSTLERLAIIDLKNLKVAFKRLSLYPIRDSNVHLSLCMSLGFNLEKGFTDDNLFSFLIWLKNQFWCMASCMHACLCMWRQVIVFGIKQMIALSLLTIATQVSNLNIQLFSQLS